MVQDSTEVSDRQHYSTTDIMIITSIHTSICNALMFLHLSIELIIDRICQLLTLCVAQYTSGDYNSPLVYYSSLELPMKAADICRKRASLFSVLYTITESTDCIIVELLQTRKAAFRQISTCGF